MALEDLKPALWGTLSDELLHLVFIRLPVPELSQIRLLSKAWKRSIDSVDSYLSGVLEDTVYPSLFGLIDLDDLCTRVFDVKRDQWCIRSIDPSFDCSLAVSAADGELDCSDSESAENSPSISTMGAADGGLVCFVSETNSESAENPLSVVVMNPLTGEKVGLPHLLSVPNAWPSSKPSMVQLMMDRQSNQYKVLVAAYAQRGYRGLFAQIYDSQTKQWSVVGSGEKSGGRIFGYEYVWVWMDDVSYSFEQREGPCLYDFAEGQLHHFRRIVQGLSGSSYALLGDRLFVLHEKRRADPSNLIQSGQEPKCYISEYHLPKSGTAWVKVETHSCGPFEDFPQENHLMQLHACNGFLLVIGQAGVWDSNNVFVAPDKYEFVWLYNLSTSKWQVLPKVPGLHTGTSALNLMCELRWSARP